MQLVCAHHDLVLLSVTFASEDELRKAVEGAAVPAQVAMSSMFTREVELSREQLEKLGFSKVRL